MRYLISILLFLTIAGKIEGSSQINMKPLWWNIMRVEYTPGEPPPPPVLGPLGFGVNATGALAGDPTVTVTNTSGGTGTGSLRWALQTSQGTDNKFIVFDIAGAGPHTIDVGSGGIEINTLSNVTIDGGNEVIQITTAQGGGGGSAGISLRNNSHHIIIKNLYFINCGSGNNNSETDGLNVIDGAHDITITNCVAYGNTDGNIDFAAGAFNVTMQYTIIGNHISNNTAGAGGTLITTDRITLHHNLFNVKSTEEGERTPFLHGNYDPAFADIRYNIMYNWGRDNATGTGVATGIGYNGSSSDCGCYARANIVNNYYYTQSTAADQDGIDLTPDNNGRLGAAYSAGNISGNGFNFNTGAYTNSPEFAIASTFQLPFETTCNAVANVLANVGPQTKSAQATALIAEITNLGSCSSGYPSLEKRFQWFGATFRKNEEKTAIPMMEYVAVINRRNKYLAKIKTPIL